MLIVVWLLVGWLVERRNDDVSLVFISLTPISSVVYASKYHVLRNVMDAYMVDWLDGWLVGSLFGWLVEE